MLKQIYSYCMQGDVEKAYRHILSMPNSRTAQALAQKYYNRFYKDRPILRVKSKDPWIRKVILAYYEYFIAVLTKKLPAQSAEAQLLERLTELLPHQSEGFADLDQAESELEQQFQQKGYYFLGGVTAPYRGPYIWKNMEKKVYQVDLPHSTQEVTVYLMSDFLLHSWLHFATFGARATGGWAKEDGLYCVYERYKKGVEGPDFQITFLKHEAQHLSDYQRFPNLTGKDLEYRAKLVELIYDPSPKRLGKFMLDAKNDPTLPHPYASYLLLKNLSKKIFQIEDMEKTIRWKKIKPLLISETARELYDQHTEQLLGAQQGS